MQEFNIKDIVKDNKVYFLYAREGKLYYGVDYLDKTYQFPTSFSLLNGIGNSTFMKEDKAIYFMRYIRKAIDSDEFILTNKG